MQVEIPSQREPSSLRHHFDLGVVWLDKSDGGDNGIPLIYAAFEFRLAIERLGVHYLLHLRGGSLTARDKRKIIRSYGNIDQEIRGLVGHQLTIDRTFDFFRLLIKSLGLQLQFATPNLRDLVACYDECSDACHITLNLTCEDAAVRQEMFGNLKQVRECLENLVSQPTGFPNFESTALDALRQRFIVGEDVEADLNAFIAQNGIYATFNPNDGSGETVVAARPPRPPENMPDG